MVAGSLASDLLKASKRPYTTGSQRALGSYERNAGKPCTMCGNPKRHVSKSGRCYTTLCTECYKADGRVKAFKRKAKACSSK